MKKLLIGLTSILIVGCTSVDPYTGEKKVSSTTKGAVGGAILGAVAGQLAGQNTTSAVTGAIAGAGVGAGVGYYFDRQEAKLREELKSTGVGIKRVEEGKLELVMPGNLTFRTASSAINPSSYEVLNSIAKVLSEYDETAIEIVGHTDSTGNEKVNSKLSIDRANGVYYYLAGREIPKNRMTALGMGSKSPVASNKTAEGREKNRRVEIRIVSK